MDIETNDPRAGGPRVAVLFFSLSGTTRECARQIHERFGGELVEIRTVEPYPAEYDAVVARGKREWKSGVPPALEPAAWDPASSDVVFLGSPNWFSTIAPPVAAFLSAHDLAGKTILPFITHGGGGVARCVDDIRKLCPDSTVRDGVAIPVGNAAAAREQVTEWMRGPAVGDAIAKIGTTSHEAE